MEGMFRSEPMSLCQLYLQAEAAYQTVSELGELGLVQFRDLNADLNLYQRKFVTEVRRCEEMERQLRFFEKEILRHEIEIDSVVERPTAPDAKEMAKLQHEFEVKEHEIKELNNTNDSVKRNFLELTELSHVLKQTDDFFTEAEENVVMDAHAQGGIDVHKLEEAVGGGERVQLGFVAGVMPRDKVAPFMRMMWFVCKGNVFIKHNDIEEEFEDPKTGDVVMKSVFSAFFQGNRLETKVKKVCEGFRAALYPCPDSPAERHQMSTGVTARLEDLKSVLQTAEEQQKMVLTKLAKQHSGWMIQVRKMKAIYHTMNLFAVEKTNFVAEVFCTASNRPILQETLDRATKASGTTAPSLVHELPCNNLPTHFRTNKVTHGYQVLINSYGVASYQEVNPTTFTIITFPFLFSVMFGDFGHGFILFLFGLWMVVREKSLQDKNRSSEIWRIFFGGRYIIMMMGLFSLYSGLIYNDCFAKSLNLFGSAWKVIYDNKTILEHKQLTLDASDTRVYSGHPYAFGLDPIWQLSRNKITFLNGYKKKISVIFGVVQMTAGLIMSLINGMYFKKKLNIYAEFVPQLLFLWAIFGYLCVLMFIKWGVYDAKHSHCAPSLLIGLINMFMFRYDRSDKTACAIRPWYNGQEGFQIFLVLVAVSCVPWMLLTKPLLLRRWNLQDKVRKLMIQQYGDREVPLSGFDPHQLFSDPEIEPGMTKTEPLPADVTDLAEADQNITLKHSASVEEEEEEFDFGEVFIHQAIHTIEFCLGCISHTASYLRLWALSLAHAQLSEVLWSMLLAMGLSAPGFLGAFMTTMLFPAWAMLTVGILLCMEGLSAFLHTLRLHWVEYQSKFYSGEGYPFEPLSFQKLLDEYED